jgi:hypothetical protein
MMVSLPPHEGPFQGAIALEHALFCLECEVIFSGLVRCPCCSGEVVWPLTGWLSPRGVGWPS